MKNNKEASYKVAEYLLQIKAVKINLTNPYKWSSGWLSPFYCDNRVILSYPAIRTYIRQTFVDTINNQFGTPDIIAGVATGGIAIGALVAQELGLPFAYVRPEPKKHGLGNAIEGHVEAGQSVIVIEDLVSTGGSSLRAIQHLKDYGCTIKSMISVFTYNLKLSQEKFKEAKLQTTSLCSFEELSEVALQKEYITTKQYEQLKEWHTNPENWTQLNG